MVPTGIPPAALVAVTLIRHTQTAGRAVSAAGALALVAAACVMPSSAYAMVPEIAPHRAVYDMALASLRSGANVADVRGRMMFEWADACDGWTIEQRFQLSFFYAEGDQVDMTTNYATWEAKDGRSYRFNVRKLVNGAVDEELRGEAELAGTGGLARYVRPETAERKLPAGTMFPTAHTIAMLQAASAGEKVFGRTVFDGSDAEGITDVSAAVGLKMPAGEAPPARAGSHDLLDGTAWPFRLAFFTPAEETVAPEYEMSLELLENGVARSMLIDYGDFAVSAKLNEIEALPRPRC